MNILLLVVGAVAALVLLGGWRPTLSRLVWSTFGAVVALVVAGIRALAGARRHLLRGSARTRTALAFHPPGGQERPASAWDFVAPLVYGLFAGAIVLGDLVLASLRFGALLGIPVGEMPVDDQLIDLLAGVLFVAVIGTFGLLLLDVLHVTPTARPFGVVSDGARTTLRVIAVNGTALSVLAGVLFLTWGQGAIAGAPSSDLAMLFVAVFGALLVVASIIAIAGALALPLVLWLTVQALLIAIVVLTGWFLRILVAGVRGSHEVVQAVLLVATWPGETAWNWLASRPFAARVGLTGIDPAGPLPPLGGPWRRVAEETGRRPALRPVFALPAASADHLAAGAPR